MHGRSYALIPAGVTALPLLPVCHLSALVGCGRARLRDSRRDSGTYRCGKPACQPRIFVGTDMRRSLIVVVLHWPLAALLV